MSYYMSVSSLRTRTITEPAPDTNGQATEEPVRRPRSLAGQMCPSSIIDTRKHSDSVGGWVPPVNGSPENSSRRHSACTAMLRLCLPDVERIPARGGRLLQSFAPLHRRALLGQRSRGCGGGGATVAGGANKRVSTDALL